MHELMFQAGPGVKGMSERSELIPCIGIYIGRILICIVGHVGDLINLVKW